MDVRLDLDVRTACGSGRLILSYQSADESEINRPLPQAVLTRAHPARPLTILAELRERI